MNTPRQVKRFTPKRFMGPSGTFSHGLHVPEALSLIGKIVTTITLVEDLMVEVFQELTSIEDEGNARLIFRNIVSQAARLSIMRTLLEKSPLHKDKPEYYDNIIGEFARVNQVRNDYVHGLWRTREDGTMWLETENAYQTFYLKKEITLREIEETWLDVEWLYRILISHMIGGSVGGEEFIKDNGLAYPKPGKGGVQPKKERLTKQQKNELKKATKKADSAN